MKRLRKKGMVFNVNTHMKVADFSRLQKLTRFCEMKVNRTKIECLADFYVKGFYKFSAFTTLKRKNDFFS